MSTKGLTIGFFIADAVLIALCAFFYLQITAYDSHDGDVTASLLIEKVTETGNGKVIVTYAAVDSSSNVTEQSRILKVEK